VKLLYRLFLVVRALLLAIGVAMLLGVLVAAGWRHLGRGARPVLAAITERQRLRARAATTENRA
jgi:hypothetical protein